jgi:hypothetical protein
VKGEGGTGERKRKGTMIVKKEEDGRSAVRKRKGAVKVKHEGRQGVE